MLTVLNNVNNMGQDGVRIQLQNPPSPTINFLILGGIFAIAVISAVVCTVWLERTWMGVVIFIILLVSGIIIFWRYQATKPSYFMQNSTLPQRIIGGEIIITASQIDHISASKQKREFPLSEPQTLRFNAGETFLHISNKANIPLISIIGFQNSQHVKVAQAVLEGKQIKTQGKAIKMQSN